MLQGGEWLLGCVPVVWLLGAWLLGVVRADQRRWQLGTAAAVASTLLVLAAAVGLWQGGERVTYLEAMPVLGLRFDALTAVMLGLVSVIGLVILRYARTYLAGDGGQRRFVRWFFATIGSVATLTVTDHLVVLAAGWIGASLSLHQLLTYYQARPQALLAAHKKFLLSRIADLCLLGGIWLIGQTYGSYRMAEIFAAVDGGVATGPGLQVGALLLAAATIMKCAQLPFHGWLIQVMEAPTPVSALLHAGVVNLGGFLLIRLSPVMISAPAAQWLLVAVGTFTAVAAGLIMMTRVSIKVNLAWSTCAQMGFMLVECGLGAYSLALLHLVAHSLYKAYCFLGSGSVVTESAPRRAGLAATRHGLADWGLAVAAALTATIVVGAFFGANPASEPALWALVAIVAVGAGIFAGEFVAGGRRRQFLAAAASAVVLSGAYFAWHHLFATVFAFAPGYAPSVAQLTVVIAAFAIQFAIYAVSRSRPDLPALQRLHAYLYHGLYLDELFTRLTMRLWPPRLTRVADDDVMNVAVLQQQGVN